MNVVVPDLGEAEAVEVVEILAAPGDRVAAGDPLVVIESEKASMDLPAPAAGVVTSIEVAVGDKVETGTLVAGLDTGAGDGAGAPSAESAEQEPKPDGDTPAGAPAAQDGTPATGTGSGGEAPPASPGASADPRGAAPAADDPAPAPETPPPPDAAIPEDVDVRADLVVLGAGPGGYTAAFRAADLGLSTVLVERSPTLGGVCLNVGCIPSKALLGAAGTMAAVEELRGRGVDYGKPRIDLGKLVSWKDEVVRRLTDGLAGLAKRRKVEVVQGTGRFEGPHVLAVETAGGGVRRIGFANAIVAAGSEPVQLPDFPHDDPRVVDSTGALAPTAVPQRLLVVGGGIIGLEMATVYAALGSRVTVVELLDELIPECDRDLVRPLEKRMAERCHAILLGTRIAAVEPRRRGLEVRFESGGGGSGGGGGGKGGGGKSDGGDGKPQVYDRVLVAVGRRPAAVDAAAAGVRTDERGFIPVDETLRTNVPHVFAIGDVTGPPLLAHKAAHQGKVAAEAAAGRKSAFEAAVIPSVAYTDPELAWAGMTETRAKAEGLAVEKAAFPWAASGRALGMGRSEGLTKLVFDAGTRRLVGAGIVGAHAGDLISEAVLAIEMGADAEDLALTVHPHPTLSETVGFAAEMAAGTITDLYVPRRK